jgi:hypothetical protein
MRRASLKALRSVRPSKPAPRSRPARAGARTADPITTEIILGAL